MATKAELVAIMRKHALKSIANISSPSSQASSFWKLLVRLILLHCFQGSGLTTCCYEQSTDCSKGKEGGELKDTKHEE